MSEVDPEICRTCDNSRAWHEMNKPMHPFNNGEAGATAFLGTRRDRDTQRRGSGSPRPAETPPTVVWPTDPVLRVALVTAGVITTDDLRKAEDMLKASMGLGGESIAKSPAEAWRGQVQVGAPASVDVGEQAVSGEEVGARPIDQ